MKTAFLVIALALVLAWYLSFLASRLDRLHHRVETSWEHLDALLQRRAAIALEIAHLPAIDAATSLVLMASAHQAREASILERSESPASKGMSTSTSLAPMTLFKVSPFLIGMPLSSLR